MNSPLFVGDWLSLGLVHMEVLRQELQPSVPFELDLFEDKAYVSLVFFTMHRMRLARGPRILNLLFYPFREQRFLNVRTYVRHRGERGIHFIAEWISNPVCACLGPPLYSLPYRRGQHQFQLSENKFAAQVTDLATQTSVKCEFQLTEPLRRCEPESLDEFFLERYAAFNGQRDRRKAFRVSHKPWQQCRADATICDDSLLRANFPWFANTRIIGANYAPGVRDVSMSWPVKVPDLPWRCADADEPVRRSGQRGRNGVLALADPSAIEQISQRVHHHEIRSG
jgi:uncharacterized protein